MPSARAASTLAGLSSMKTISFGRRSKRSEQNAKDLRRRFDDALDTRHHDSRKPREEVEALLGIRERFCRPVRQTVQRYASAAELICNGNAPGDGAAHHLGPAFPIRLDQRSLVRHARAEFVDRLRPRAACVQLFVPLRCADRRQECLDGCIVRQQLAIQMTWIPIDQHAAEIEYDGLLQCGAGALMNPTSSGST